MAKRYNIGRLPDLRAGDSFPVIKIVSETDLSDWTIMSEIIQTRTLVRLGLDIVDVSTMEKRIDSFIENFGSGNYIFRVTFTSPGGFKSTSFEGNFSIVNANMDVNHDDAGVQLNISVMESSVVELNVTPVSIGAELPDDIIDEEKLNAALAKPALFVDPSLILGYLKPDGETETDENDPEAVMRIGIAGPAPETLPTPVFGTVTKNSESFSLPITNLPAGAAVVWTVGGVTDAATGATLAKNGLTASTPHNVTAKFTKAGVIDSTVASITVTTDGGSALLRTIKLNTSSEFAAVSNTNSPNKWNDLRVTSAQIQAVNGFVSGNLVTSDNLATTITATNSGAFAGHTSQVFTSYPGSARLPAAIGNSAWRFDGGSNAALRLNGLDDTKKYKIYVLCASPIDGDEVNITVSGEAKTKVTYNNYGNQTGAELTDAMWTVFENRTSTAGALTIEVERNAGSWDNMLEAVVIEEYS